MKTAEELFQQWLEEPLNTTMWTNRKDFFLKTGKSLELLKSAFVAGTLAGEDRYKAMIQDRDYEV